MTRDEATRKLFNALMRKSPSSEVNNLNWCGAVVDGLADLEILKLDYNPDNHLEALAMSMELARSSGPLTAAKVAGHLEVMGFKVVKK
jgi:hypothetical protein